MKKWMLLSIMFGATALQTLAQVDDMYFVPTKKNIEAERGGYGGTNGSAYSGSLRSVDDYNRMGSFYEVMPTDTSDIIAFNGAEGVYPDSLSDFQLTQQLTRFDGYEPSADYWVGYARGLNDSSWGWHSPWYYSSFYPWYDTYWYSSYWYDPWYWDTWHFGLYRPWYSWRWGWGGYYGYYSYYRPHYYYYGGGIGGSRHHYATTSGTGTIDRYGRTGGTYSHRSTISAGRMDQATRRTVNGHTAYPSTNRTGSGLSSGSGNFTGSRGSNTYAGSRNTSTYTGSTSGGSRSSGSYSGGGGFSGSRSSGGARSAGSRR